MTRESGIFGRELSVVLGVNKMQYFRGLLRKEVPGEDAETNGVRTTRVVHK